MSKVRSKSALSRITSRNSHDEVARSLVRFSTAGNVDNGKSTLIGRLLSDTGSYKDEPPRSLAFFTDGLKAEREQGITIDVAYRYFSTAKRQFILADAPGHDQYTRNMATAASTAQCTILLIDVRQGVVPQTRRHAFIASLMGVPRLLVAINKMDLVRYDQAAFDSVKAQFLELVPRLGFKEVRFIPISAKVGDNVVERSLRMSWYKDGAVLEFLDQVHLADDTNMSDFRFFVQRVVRRGSSYCGYAGQVSSGVIRPGDETVLFPSMQKTTIESIEVFDGRKMKRLSEARPPMSVTLRISRKMEIARGDLLVKPDNLPALRRGFEAFVVWMGDAAMARGKNYIVRHGTKEALCTFERVVHKVEMKNLDRVKGNRLLSNEIGRVKILSTTPLFLDPYTRNRATGSFIVIDPDSLSTVAAGMVVDTTVEHIGEGHRADG